MHTFNNNNWNVQSLTQKIDIYSEKYLLNYNTSTVFRKDTNKRLNLDTNKTSFPFVCLTFMINSSS